ncbi:hypothetical protein [Prauserella flavalba]|uniref:hypothetical protein n=1 Tax=Prauserella flavalba TaxID=1477506 RepID=UPI00143DD447|nr:hypothetical protein [Prauserella flavalba]
MRAPHVRTGLRTALLVLEAAVTALKDDEPLAVVARALVVAGDMIAGAGEHKRS